MSEGDWTLMLRSHGIRPTANRIILLRALSAADSSLTLSELEHRIQSIDKSGLSRALSLFRQCHLVHDVEDGDGSVRYELCTGSGGREDDTFGCDARRLCGDRYQLCSQRNLPVVCQEDGAPAGIVRLCKKKRCSTASLRHGTSEGHRVKNQYSDSDVVYSFFHLYFSDKLSH